MVLGRRLLESSLKGISDTKRVNQPIVIPVLDVNQLYDVYIVVTDEDRTPNRCS